MSNNIDIIKVEKNLDQYSPARAAAAARFLADYWKQFQYDEGIKLIKKDVMDTAGVMLTPVPVMKAIGKAIARRAAGDVSGYLPLARLLWDKYRREGRVAALIILGGCRPPGYGCPGAFDS